MDDAFDFFHFSMFGLSPQQPFCLNSHEFVKQYAHGHDEDGKCHRQEEGLIVTDIFDPDHDRDELKPDDTDGATGNGTDPAAGIGNTGCDA